MKRAGLLVCLFVSAGLSQGDPKSAKEQALRKRIEALNALRNTAAAKDKLPTSANGKPVCSIPLLGARRLRHDDKVEEIPQTQGFDPHERTAPIPAPPCNESQFGK